MRRAMTLFVMTCLLSTSASFAGHSRIDQENPAVDNLGPTVTFGVYGPLNQYNKKLAQVFTPALNGSLKHVMVPIACNSSATVTVSIQEVVGGIPSTAIYASENIPGDTYPLYTGPYTTVPDAGFRLVQFSLPPYVYAGTQYAIVLASNGRCTILSSPSGDFYTGGRGYYQSFGKPPAWILLAPPNGPSDDFPFQTFVDDDEPVIR